MNTHADDIVFEKPNEPVFQNREKEKRKEEIIIDHYETVRLKKSSEQFYVSLTVSPLKDRALNIIGISKIVRDITSRRKSEADISNANKQPAFQNEKKENCAAELDVPIKNLLFKQNEKAKKCQIIYPCKMF
jgi:hypothetical protein